MRITKELSDKLATKLLEKKQEKLNKLREKKSLFVKEKVIALLPKDILELFNKKPNYFRSRRSFAVLTNSGYHMGNINIQCDMPYDEYEVRLNQSDSKVFEKLDNEFTFLKSDINKLHEQTESVLYSLRTYKRIIESFPELESVLATEQKANTELLDINTLRKQINS